MQQIDQIIQKLRKIEEIKAMVGRKARELNESFAIGPNEEIPENKMIISVKGEIENVNAVGIDGGIVKSSLHGLDLLVYRAVGVNFVYENKVLTKIDYHPSAIPEPDRATIIEALSEIDLAYCYNFIRQIKEIEIAIQSLEKFKPDLLLLDGSVIPHYITKPENEFAKEFYKILLKKYKEFFEKSRKTVVAGIIEDSRGNKFCDILIRRVFSSLPEVLSKDSVDIISRSRDSNVLHYMLEKGERTCIFNYTLDPQHHPIIKEFGKDAEKFMSFYVRTVEFDRPLRVDFIANDNPSETANKISDFLIATSGNANYGLPAILIEADQRAKLRQEDLEIFYYDLINKSGNLSITLKLRRESRPF
ncbi:MAG: DNA double-strand break repair nuclease NurA [Candidatus Aenigmarchaeota archaeon]|nr:DNA double-strand break repair nuclease NurA [Candidatus Aenigmarchaeota archaeon]